MLLLSCKQSQLVHSTQILFHGKQLSSEHEMPRIVAASDIYSLFDRDLPTDIVVLFSTLHRSSEASSQKHYGYFFYTYGNTKMSIKTLSSLQTPRSVYQVKMKPLCVHIVFTINRELHSINVNQPHRLHDDNVINVNNEKVHLNFVLYFIDLSHKEYLNHTI